MSFQIGQKVKNLRKKLGLSQQDFAIKIGYSSGAMISKIESGERTPHWDYLQKMADFAGLGLDYFVGNEAAPAEELEKQDAFIAFKKMQELILQDSLPDLATYLRIRYNYSQDKIEEFLELQQKLESCSKH